MSPSDARNKTSADLRSRLAGDITRSTNLPPFRLRNLAISNLYLLVVTTKTEATNSKNDVKSRDLKQPEGCGSRVEHSTARGGKPLEPDPINADAFNFRRHRIAHVSAGARPRGTTTNSYQQPPQCHSLSSPPGLPGWEHDSAATFCAQDFQIRPLLGTRFLVSGVSRVLVFVSSISVSFPKLADESLLPPGQAGRRAQDVRSKTAVVAVSCRPTGKPRGNAERNRSAGISGTPSIEQRHTVPSLSITFSSQRSCNDILTTATPSTGFQ